jgi:hypothetical protein
MERDEKESLRVNKRLIETPLIPNPTSAKVNRGDDKLPSVKLEI